MSPTSHPDFPAVLQIWSENDTSVDFYVPERVSPVVGKVTAWNGTFIQVKLDSGEETWLNLSQIIAFHAHSATPGPTSFVFKAR